MPDRTGTGEPWPRLTIVTPSFNHGRYIEETIRSVLLQGYPHLEYFIFDGGSSDQTVEIIRKYSSWIDYWISEGDGGQSAAINCGLQRGSGVLATWINSDDMLCMNALSTHFANHPFSPMVVYVGDCLNVDDDGAVLFTHRGRVDTFEDLVRVKSVWNSGGYICQPEVLFPLDLARQVGGLNENNHYSMDYELWGELLLAGCLVRYTNIPFGMFRRHEEQKSFDSHSLTDSTLTVAARLIAGADCLSAAAKQDLLADLERYRKEYPEILWRHSGRLTRLGLPRWLVHTLRGLRAALHCSIGFAAPSRRGGRAKESRKR